MSQVDPLVNKFVGGKGFTSNARDFKRRFVAWFPHGSMTLAHGRGRVGEMGDRPRFVLAARNARWA
jgi:hypothetical protein